MRTFIRLLVVTLTAVVVVVAVPTAASAATAIEFGLIAALIAAA
jgi:hypothetical protein